MAAIPGLDVPTRIKREVPDSDDDAMVDSDDDGKEWLALNHCDFVHRFIFIDCNLFLLADECCCF